MLSNTYSIVDTKAKLEKDYTAWNYASDAAYTAALTGIFSEIKLFKMYGYIGEATYTVIETKDKVDLKTVEEQIYWAEVFYVCADFIKSRNISNDSNSFSLAGENLNVEGYSYSTSDSGGETGAEKSSAYWKGKANHALIQSGYNVNELVRSGGIFGAN